MYQVIIVGHVLVGLGVIGLVLIQHGKGADAGAAFGSGSSGTVFGAQGSASFLSRTTAILAAVFFSTSLALAVMSGKLGNDADLMDIPAAEQAAMEVPTIEGDQPIVATPIDAAEELPQIAGDKVVTIETEQAIAVEEVQSQIVDIVDEEAVIAVEQPTVDEGIPNIPEEDFDTLHTAP
ncbi:MAG: preprotein translocase subunit SecG [Methyloprofundus sp.]|nr:preprotein translocase subunit SecG [Methyloprofundus sp.]